MTRSTSQAIAAPALPQPFDICLESENYRLRPLVADDVTERVCAWFADPSKAVTINRAPRALTRDELCEYIASHDRVSGHIIGMFEKASGKLIGFWSAYIDWERREFLLNILVGEGSGGRMGARRETGHFLYHHLYDVLDLETMRCAVLASNTRMDARFEFVGLTPEHISFAPSATKQSFEEIHHYSVPREMWHRYRKYRYINDTVAAAKFAAWSGI